MPVWAAGDAELIRQQQREQQWQSQHLPEIDVYLDDLDTPVTSSTLPLHESPCAVIRQIQVSGVDVDFFRLLLPKLIKQTGFQPEMCLGGKGIQILQTAAQNLLIEAGFVTSQAVIAPQDLASGSLTIEIQAGYLAKIDFPGNSRFNPLAKPFPSQSGAILNLRDVEQGLENLRRLPTVSADLNIQAAEQENASDIVVNWQQDFPLRLQIGADDSGSRTTGKYQGNATLFWDNPLHLSDLLYVSYNHDLGHKSSYTDSEGIKTQSGTRGHSLHYSLPFGYWLLSFNYSRYRYHEATEGYTLNYDYNGSSSNIGIALARVLSRSSSYKTTAAVKLWQQRTKKYLDDIEIEVQRRQTAGWAIDLNHRMQWRQWNMSGGVAFKRGTGMANSQKAPEEYNDDNDVISGTSRMKIINAHLYLSAPFNIGTQRFSFDSSWQAQWNKTPLTPPDKFSIGGRYTVRGFNGDNSLIGERGWFVQNNLNQYFLPTHQLYLGLDFGHVAGISAQHRPSQQLTGAVLGIKGTHKLGGIFSYDLFAGKPLSQPKNFQVAKSSYGFSVNYEF